jgi:peptidyl-prolyl cis-trans isomerase D
VVVFRVTDIVDPPVDFASDAIAKLKESLDRALIDEQVASYVNKLETDIGTSINQAAFAQVTGANQ